MRKLIVVAALVMLMSSALFASYLGVEGGAAFYTGRTTVYRDHFSEKHEYSESVGYYRLTAVAELADSTGIYGIGAEATAEKPFHWRQCGNILDVTDRGFKIKEVCLYMILAGETNPRPSFKSDPGIYYRRDTLPESVGGDECNVFGLMCKIEYRFDNPSFIKPGIGFRAKVPLISMVAGETFASTDGISLGAYVTIGIGD